MPLSVADHLKQTIDTLSRMATQTEGAEDAARRMIDALKKGKKIVVFGNGGSAADAQHFAAELTGRFEAERTPLPAVALTTDTSALTAIGNDYGYDHVFSRQVNALVSEGDIVVAISTSGNSKSVLEGAKAAKVKKAVVIGMTNQTGGQLKAIVDLCLCAPSPRTANVQECHISLIHGICARIDQAFLPATV